MDLPTLFRGDPPKCGTTATWRILHRRSQVFIANGMEPGSFSRTNVIGDGIARLGNVREIHDGQRMDGYTSPFDTALPCLHQQASTAALDRLHARAWHERKTGIELALMDQLANNDAAEFRFYTGCSSCRAQLASSYQHVPSDQVLALLDAELGERTAETFQTVDGIIGAGSRSEPRAQHEERKPRASTRITTLASVMAAGQHASLTQRLPPTIKRALGRVRERLTWVNARSGPNPRLSSDLRSLLMPRFRNSIDFIEDLLDRRLESWRRVQS